MTAIIAGLALAIQYSAASAMNGVFGHILRNALESGLDAGELFINTVFLGDARLVTQAGETVATGLFNGAAVLLVMLVILILTWIRPNVAYALVGLCIMEMLCYAASTRATMDATPDLPPMWAKVIGQIPKDARVLDSTDVHSNFGMWFGYDDLWGYDPGVLKRYAELVTRSQGGQADDATQYVQFGRVDPRIFPLLRVAAIFTRDPKNPVVSGPPPMSLAQLVPSAFVLKDRDSILSSMQSDSFDPRRAVLLESDPTIKPAGGPIPGTVRIVSQSSDHIELVADVSANAMLLITNSYSKGWRVWPVGPAPQADYTIMPADWALQAIALAPGTHHLWLQYRPWAFVAGEWISVLAVLGYIAAVVWYFRRHANAARDRTNG
jgi:hypothetical protein